MDRSDDVKKFSTIKLNQPVKQYFVIHTAATSNNRAMVVINALNRDIEKCHT